MVTLVALSYFLARYYDSYIGRWLSVDPLADKYPDWSPYNYTLNNPLRYVDKDGNEPISLSAAAATGLVIAGGAIITAGVYSTYQYIKNPSTAPAPNETNIKNLGIATTTGVLNEISNWFSSDNDSKTEEQENKGRVKEQSEKISKEIGKNSVTLPDGSRVDLTGKGHTNKKTGQEIETPHTHDIEKNTNPKTGKTYTKTKRNPRPTTQEDIDNINETLK